MQNKTFKPKVVCQVTGVPHGTLNAWDSRGYLDGIGKSFRPGKAREYSFADLIVLHIMRTLTSTLKVSADQAATLARVCLKPCGEMLADRTDSAAKYLFITFGPTPQSFDIKIVDGIDSLQSCIESWISSDNGDAASITVDIAKALHDVMQKLQAMKVWPSQENEGEL